MLVRDRMQREPVTVGPDTTLASALELTRSRRIRHLPVVLSTGELTGIVSDRDIRLAMPSPLTVPDAERAEFLRATAVAAVMTREVITAAPTDTLEDAARRLYRHRIGSLPVIEGDRLVGIVTETDMLHAFVQILGGTRPASRIEVALADHPGELARAVRVIGEELRVNIVSLVVPDLPERRRATAVLHLDTIDPREPIRALERDGFEVGWPSLDHDLRSPGQG